MGKRRECEVCGAIAQVWRRAVWLKCDGTSKSTKVCAACSRRAFVFVVSPPQVGRIVVEDGQRKAMHDLASPVVLPAGRDGIASRIEAGADELAKRAEAEAEGRRFAEELAASRVVQSAEAKRNPCPSVSPVGDRCAFVAGHAAEHRAGLHVWSDPPVSAGRALAKRARAVTRNLAKRATAAATKPCELCEGKGSYPNPKAKRPGDVAWIECEAAGCVGGQVKA